MMQLGNSQLQTAPFSSCSWAVFPSGGDVYIFSGAARRPLKQAFLTPSEKMQYIHMRLSPGTHCCIEHLLANTHALSKAS